MPIPTKAANFLIVIANAFLFFDARQSGKEPNKTRQHRAAHFSYYPITGKSTRVIGSFIEDLERMASGGEFRNLNHRGPGLR
jgi:hypothetical protein